MFPPQTHHSNGRSAWPVLWRVWSPYSGAAGLRDGAEGVRTKPLPRARGEETRRKDDATAAATSDRVMGATAHGVRQHRAGSRQRGMLLELTNHLVHCPTKFGVDGELKREGAREKLHTLK